MTSLEDKKKHKEAAQKAWKTMRREKREKASKSSAKITSFINPETIEKIRHPETIGFKEERELPWNGNRIVMPFDKTPPDIACGMFWELRWAYGCPHNCSYCYLRGTMRGRMKPQYVRTELVLHALDEAFEKIKVPAIFNSGELSDSLMNPQLMKPIVDKFEMQKTHKIYLLSKCGIANVSFLAAVPRKQVICGWSINAPEVAKLWEKGASSPKDRMEAAALVSKIGYDTRIRIDPIFPIENWQTYYGDLLYDIMAKFTPNRIILGTPRGLWKTIKYAKEANIDVEWTRFFEEDSSWGKKLAFDQRKQIYEFFLAKLDNVGYQKNRISICKETVELSASLNPSYHPGICSCYSFQR